jgi:hypothetical protein
MRQAITLSTGRDYAAVRLASGIGRRPLAAILGVNYDTLARWEMSNAPVAPDRAERWRKALSDARAQREADLAAAGFSLADLARGAILAGQLATKV